MSAKCSKCGMLIFDEKGQCWGTQLPNGDWVCDDDCELGLSLKPEGPVLTLKEWNRRALAHVKE